ncbi:MAG: hypothetical protein O3A14_01790 [Cyanobacteria bacterium]|nr:hypothetical protein [Cyanobacteriota bacterium]
MVLSGLVGLATWGCANPGTPEQPASTGAATESPAAITASSAQQQATATAQASTVAPPDDGFGQDDDRFIQQDFSQALFEQVHQINQDCGFYDITSSCHVRIYAFRDASLITALNGTESVKFTLTLYQPISQGEAWDYVQILNDGQDLNLIESERQGSQLVFRGCPYDAGSTEPAALCVAAFFLHQDDSVSGVTLTQISP